MPSHHYNVKLLDIFKHDEEQEVLDKCWGI